jgi:hypothetical protein
VRQHDDFSHPKCVRHGAAVLPASAAKDCKREGARVMPLNFSDGTNRARHVFVCKGEHFAKHDIAIAPACKRLAISRLFCSGAVHGK